jgi:ferredoxin
MEKFPSPIASKSREHYFKIGMYEMPFRTVPQRKVFDMIVITEDCINCNACIDECPSNAIYGAGETYKLNGEEMPPLSNDYTFSVPELCTMCEGYSPEPSCMGVCPSDAVINN